MTNVLVAILLAALNSLWQAALAAGLVWAALKALPKVGVAVNAATRYAIWWVVLALVLALPLAPGLRNELRLMWTPRTQPPAAADSIRAHRVTVPVTVEAPAPVMLPQPKSAARHADPLNVSFGETRPSVLGSGFNWSAQHRLGLGDATASACQIGTNHK